MQDPDIPPQAEEDTNGAVDGVRQNEALMARWAANARSIKVFLPLPWITATAPTWAWIMATATREEDPDGPVFRRHSRSSILSPSPLRMRMQLRASSPLSRTSSF